MNRVPVPVLCVAALTLLLTAACHPERRPDPQTPAPPAASATQRSDAALDAPPAWTRTPHVSNGRDHLFVGYGQSRQGERAALEAARAKALGELALWLNAEVASTISVEDVADSQQGDAIRIRNSSVVASKPITVRHSEQGSRFVRENAGLSEAWTQVRVSAEELRRIERLSSARTAWRFQCEPENLCPPNLVASLKAFATSRHLHTQPEPIAVIPPTAADIRAQADSLDAAFILEVRLETERQARQGDFHFAHVRLDWRLISVDDGTELAMVTVGPVKAGHLNYEQAVQKAFVRLLEELSEKIDTPPNGAPRPVADAEER